MKNKHELYMSQTMVSDNRGNIVAVPTGDVTAETARYVGIALPEWRTLLGASAALYRNSVETSNALERLLTILESQGLERIANDLQNIIAAQKLYQKVAIEGHTVLTEKI